MDAPNPYITKDQSLIRELLHPKDIPGLGMSLAEATVDAGGITARHCHPEFDEIYYGLEGEGILYIDDQPHPFKLHSYYLLPRNTWHWLKADSRLRLLCVCCPGYTHEGTMLETSDPLSPARTC